MRRVSMCLGLGSMVFLLLTCTVLEAQDNYNFGYGDTNGKRNEEKGPTASELFTASSSNISGMLSFDTSIGYNVTKNLGIEAGVPYLFDTRPGVFAGTSGRLGYVNYPYVGCTFFFGCYTGIATSARIWGGELGDVYADVHYTRPYKRYNFLTVATGDAPTASFRKGLTTGRTQWDWFNHIDTDIHGFTPFLNAGLANGRMDQHFLPRPFEEDLPLRTLGYMADFEGGLEYKIWQRFTLGYSVWDVLPMGPQKIYSNLVWENATPGVATVGPGGVFISGVVTGPSPVAANPAGPGNFGYLAGNAANGRYWNSAFETSGNYLIDRDNGYTASLGIGVFKNMDIQVAYNHSVRYRMDTVLVTFGININSAFRKLTSY